MPHQATEDLGLHVSAIKLPKEVPNQVFALSSHSGKNQPPALLEKASEVGLETHCIETKTVLAQFPQTGLGFQFVAQLHSSFRRSKACVDFEKGSFCRLGKPNIKLSMLFMVALADDSWAKKYRATARGTTIA